MELLQSFLREWNKETNERAKLQRAYIALVAIIIIIAGLITLVNADLGHLIVTVAGLLALACFTNAVLWALLKSFVIDRITAKRSNK
jgi:cell division protein FtsW (lipid II flippase)